MTHSSFLASFKTVGRVASLAAGLAWSCATARPPATSGGERPAAQDSSKPPASSSATAAAGTPEPQSSTPSDAAGSGPGQAGTWERGGRVVADPVVARVAAKADEQRSS